MVIRHPPASFDFIAPDLSIEASPQTLSPNDAPPRIRPDIILNPVAMFCIARDSIAPEPREQ